MDWLVRVVNLFNLTMMRTLFTFCALVISLLAVAQQQRWESGIFLGGANYQGDLVRDWIPELKETGWAAGAFGRYLFSPVWGVRAGLSYGRFTGSDQNLTDPFIQEQRSLRFATQVAEASVQLEWEPFGQRRYPEERSFRPVISPYFFLGAGALRVETDVDFSHAVRDYFQEDIEQDKSTTYPFWRFTIPVGAGVKLDLSRKVVVGLELGTRTAFTDFLDGVSHTGNPDRNDWYTFGGLSLARRFGPPDKDRDGFPDKEDACPRIPGVASANGCPDADGDGVEDLEDLCPNDWGLPSLNGCPDLDGDGIIDLLDECPRLPGSIHTKGCPDTDGDGIADAVDDCPEAAGFPELNGCPDTDFDGIIDPEDDCPEEPGPAEKGGCIFVDTDGDGLFDSIDRCPEIPGAEDLLGCPDTDDDGIADMDDKCPDTPGPAANGGCPVVTEADRAILVEAREEVQFNTGSAVLKPESGSVLDRVADLMQRYPDYFLYISGHTDSVGKAEKNQKLSEERAEACYQYLMDQGVAPERMAYEGFGETQPIGNNNTVAGRRQNRRVEFELKIK